MTSLTLPVTEDMKKQFKNFMWVNWSEIAREEATKKVIFENYMKTKNLTDEEWKFCEKIDWHPVDELPLKEDFIKKMKEIKRGKFRKYNNIEELFAKIK